MMMLYIHTHSHAVWYPSAQWANITQAARSAEKPLAHISLPSRISPPCLQQAVYANFDIFIHLRTQSTMGIGYHVDSICYQGLLIKCIKMWHAPTWKSQLTWLLNNSTKIAFIWRDGAYWIFCAYLYFFHLYQNWTFMVLNFNLRIFKYVYIERYSSSHPYFLC